MGIFNNREICEQIINALDIADIIGERIKLKQASRGFTGLCPFHEERTPSFHVYTDTQSYYCFGCHEAGNIFTYLMKADNMSFPEAVKTLADRAGIELPKYEKPGERTAYEILDLVAKFYADNLKSGARAYLERRKIDDADISKFAIGYAPSSWDALVRYLRNLKVTDKQMLDLGLALWGKHGLYDKFRGRIIFPIRDIAGRVIAFGGRLIDGDGAKYMNSPESEVYHKRKNLYLLDKARNTIRERKRSILVEGYMDALRLHKCGFTEAVASLGTSLTAEQAETLSRFADRCYICYDSDKAGQSATIRGMYILAENGLDVYVISLPNGKDPDEFLCSNSPEEFENAIQSAKPLILKHIEVLTPALKDLATRKSAMKELFESLLRLNIAEVMQYKTQLSEITAVPPSKIEEWFVSKHKQALPDEEVKLPVKTERTDFLLEAGLCSMLLNHAECRISLNLKDVYKILKGSIAQNVATAFLNNDPEDMINLWLSTGSTDEISLITRGNEFCVQMKGLNVSEKWQKIYDGLRTRAIMKRVQELTLKMQKSQATPQELLELKELKGKMNQRVKA